MKSSVIKKLTVTAILTSMVIIMSSFSIPVPGGHVYLNDIIIVTAGILLGPAYAVLAGGFGAFMGDFIFYPLPMFVSLVVHGLQALIISLCSVKRRKWLSIVGVAIGCIITIVGYTFGRAYIYSTPENAVLKLPYQILQNVIGSVAGVLLSWNCGIVKIYDRIIGGNPKSNQ